ncbi:MAG: HEAT repeat domain-containing protein [Methanobacterium sp.]|nr:HEAT repeat domain-containing protein [Methanobacterium sp.]
MEKSAPRTKKGKKARRAKLAAAREIIVNEVSETLINDHIPSLIQGLSSSSSSERNKNVYKLVKIGEPAFEPILAASNNSNAVIRRKVCDVLGLMGNARAVKPLIKLLKDPNSYVRRRAANALIQVNNKEAVEPLCAALNDSEYKVRLRALEALGNIGDPRAILPLSQSLKDPESSVRDKSEVAIRKISQTPSYETTAYLSIATKEFNNCVEIGEPAIIPLINSFNSDIQTRNGAVKAIVEIGEPAVEPLINALNNPNPVIIKKVCDALGLIGDPKAVIPLTERLKNDDSSVRRKAAKALILVGDERAVKPLCKSLLDSDTRVCMLAAEALGEIGDESAIPSLVSSLDSTIGVSQAAKEALKKFGSTGLKFINEHEEVKTQLEEEKAAIKREELINELELLYSTKTEINNKDFEIIVNAKYVPGLIKVVKGELVYEKDEYPMYEDLFPEPVRSIDMDVTLPCVAANHLGEIGDELAISSLTNTLLNESRHTRIRYSCLMGLDKIGTIRSYHAITNSLIHLDGDLFIRAIDCLDDYGGGLDTMEREGDIKGLIRVFSMYDIDREYPISGFAFGRLKTLHDNGAPVVEHLFKAMDDDSYKNSEYCIKCHFIRALGDLGDKRSIYGLILRSKESEPEVRKWAILSLYKLGEENSFKQLCALFKDSSDLHFRHDATIAFMHAREKRAVDLIINGLFSFNEEIRKVSAQALGEIGDPKAVNVLISISDDPVTSVRESAILSLCKIRDKRAYQTFIEKLHDESPYIKRIARKALVKLDNPSTKVVPKSIVVKKFEFEYSVPLWIGSRIFVKIDDHKIFYTSHKVNGSPDEFLTEMTEEYPISEEKWIDFWEMMDQIDIFDWKESYTDDDVYDGDLWSLKIQFHDKTLTSGGSNAYPPAFRQFLFAIQELTSETMDFNIRVINNIYSN